jgi:preprotein translocase subunit Sec63
MPSKQIVLQSLVSKAVEEQWTTGKLAEQAGVHYSTAKEFMRKMAAQGEKKALDRVLRVSSSYRSTLETAAARSREYLETIEDKALSELTANERQLRREALASLTTIGGLLKFSEPAASAPEKLGNL